MLVLWTMTILCAVALEMSFSSHLRAQVTANISTATKTHFLARAGVERAIAELVATRDEVQSLADLYGSDTETYENVELGEGSYTLLAGLDALGEPEFGIVDEAAKVNVNTADASMLAKIPGINTDLASAIVARGRRNDLPDLNALLLVREIDLLVLYGEDQNGNGLLDPNEDDGDESWPPDNADGQLELGLAGYLTVWSGCRNVSADGGERVNLNEASAKELARTVSGLSSQEAESIVAHRKKKFEKITDLLDVELVAESSKESKEEEKKKETSGTSGKTSQEGQRRQTSSETTKSQATRSSDRKQRTSTTTETSTGKKAFDTEKFRKIADYMTITDDEVLQGRLNINTAPYEVLACLPGIDVALAQQIVSWREGRNDALETVAHLLDAPGVSIDILKQVYPYVSVRSDVFSVCSFGVMEGGGAYACVLAVIDRTDDEVKLRYWREVE